MTCNHLLLMCAAAVLGASSAVADTVQVTFKGVKGQTGFGYYLSPYDGTINGDPVVLYCNDFANHVRIGQTWEANVTALSSGDLSKTRYGGLSNALTLYKQVAWLTTQFDLDQNPRESADIQATIWRLFVSTAPLPSSDKWFTLAAEHYDEIDPSRFNVLTNVGPVFATGQVQEFIFNPPVPTPEPSSALLLGTVALSLVYLIGKRTSA